MTGAPYADLAQVREQVGVSDSSRDQRITRCLVAASDAIDDYTNRPGTGFRLDTTATPRLFNPCQTVSWQNDGGLLLIDEVGDDHGLIIEEGSTSGPSWSTVDGNGLYTQPDNALAKGQPITGILRSTFWIVDPYSRVRITAKWGWPAVPSVVTEAAIIQAARIYQRKQSLEGVVGSNDWGVIRLGRLDPDVAQMLEKYVIGGFA